MSHQELSLSGDDKGLDSRADTLTLSNSNLDLNLNMSPGVSGYDDAGSIHSESSMIFERNVEDPYSQVFSNPRLASLSRSGSHANLGFDSPQQDGSGGSAGLPAGSYNGYPVPLSRKQSNAGSFVSHHTLENLVAPALDEGVTIVNDDSTDLEAVEMIYSRRPSTIGLDMALGRTRTSSFSETATLNAQAQGAGANPRLMRTNSASQSSGPETRPRVLRFYSYADMLSDENSQNPRRPSITQSLSSTLLRQQQQQQQPGGPGLPHDPYQSTSPSFSNPFLSSQALASSAAPGNGVQPPTSPLDAQRKYSNVSIPPLSVTTRHYSNNMLSRSPNTTAAPAAHRLSSSPLMIPHNTNSALLRKSHFQIESSGSECSDEETDRDHHRSNSNNSNASNNSNSKANTIPNSTNINSPNYTQYRHSDRDLPSAGTLNTSPPNQQQGLRLSRTSTQGSGFGKKLSPPAYKARAYSNASSNSPYHTNLSRSSFSSANTQRLDDILFDEQLQSNTVSEVLKKKLTNDI